MSFAPRPALTRAIAGALFFALSLAGAPAWAQTLAGTQWRIVMIGGKAVPAAAQGKTSFSLDAEHKRMGATAGCNLMSAGYTRDGALLSFGPIMATRMACPGETDGRERALANALERTRQWRIERGALILADAKGLHLLRAAPAR